MKETELYLPIKNYFEERGYRVNGEVDKCDLVALRDDNIIAVELKVNMTVILLAQAVERQSKADYVYLAIPKPVDFTKRGKWGSIIALLKKIGLGLFFVDIKYNIVELQVEAAGDKNRKKTTKKRKHLIKELEGRTVDMNVGGSVRQQLVTAYREKALLIAVCLSRFGDLSIKQLKELGTDTKNTGNILRENFYHWFDKIERGVYTLSDKGKKELENYKELVIISNRKIDEKLSKSVENTRF